MKVGVIIVTFNSQKDIGRLLESIIIQNCRDLSVYIVDNNSSDNTLDIVKQYQSQLLINIIFCKTNNGFAKGNNIGIQKALDDDCGLLFILNPDIQLEEKCIHLLTKRILSDEKIGVIGPVVLYGNEENEIIQAYGVNVNYKTQKKVAPFSDEKWTLNLPDEIYVDFVLGGAMMIRSSVLKITGLFEEDYFMYNDELDISYRIKNAGFKTLCLRDAIVRHHHDFNKQNKTGYNTMYYYVMRNRFLFFKKFHMYFNLILSVIMEFINLPLKVIWSIRRMRNGRLLKFYYSGLIDGLKGKKGIANKSFDDNKKAKQILLTIDYELFLGKETGNVQESMIDPTQKLLLILEKNNSKMTIFWDILHYYRLLELEKSYSELKHDRILIEEQISELVGRGHDIQLHLHPHWLDAAYENGKWNFNYNRFRLHNLSSENRKEDINTITGCVSISKKLMEDIIRKNKPDYKVTTFRAGGYLIDPFKEIKNALQENDIKIDSSICPDLVNNNGIFSFDFRQYPNRRIYNFEFSAKELVDSGSFIEIPITTVKIPALVNIYFTFIRMIKYRNLEIERKGSGTGDYFKPVRFIDFRKLYSLTRPKVRQLTTDSSFQERFKYKFKKVPEYSTMILHPKLLNSHTIRILDDYVSTNKVRFISIQDFLN